jgi:hypothetical protein
MTWATMLGVDGRQQQTTTWVMMWVMMWATGTMAATMLVMTPTKGMAGLLVGRGGGGSWQRMRRRQQRQRQRRRWRLHIAGFVAFNVKIFVCGIFMMCGGIGKVTPPLTLSSCLRYVGILLGGVGNCPQKLWYVNTKN